MSRCSCRRFAAPARRHELAVGRLVVDRRDQPALVDDDPHLVVLQPGSAPGRSRPGRGTAAPSAAPRHGVRPRVGGQLAVAGPDERASARPRSPPPARRRRGRTRARPAGAPTRSTCRAGCRGTAAAAPSPSSAAASRRGTPRPSGRPRWWPTARPRAAGARCAGCRASCATGWCRCRGGTPGTARPPTPAGPGTRPPRRRRTPPDGPGARSGEPSRSRVRCAAASISRVGPPPPSPQPNGTSDVLARPFSANCRCARASSPPDSSAL